MKYAALLAAIALVLGLVWARPVHHHAARVTVDRVDLAADGYDSATLTIATEAAPRITLDPAHAATVQELAPTPNGWQAHVRAGVTPGVVTLHIGSAAVRLTLTADDSDSAADGTPDFLRLDDAADQRAFRRWFTFLAETQSFARSPEVTDCAALIRYAYREALHAHDGSWATDSHLPLVPAMPSVAKYQYPFTPLGANLFRVQAGPYRPRDAAFTQFADAKTLQLWNTHFVTRDLARALPGDLLFYRQDGGDMPFHSMIYLGGSQIENSTARYLVYHTGPGPNEVRRPRVEELLRFPDPEWRPVPDNPRFLGVYRWNILRGTS